MTYQQERDQFIANFARTFPTVPVTVAASLLRLSTTLHRLAEAQCNGDYPYDNGERKVIPCPACEAGTVRAELKGKHGTCPDCRATARVNDLVMRHLPTHKAIAGGDPRGCVLVLYSKTDTREDIDTGRARGLAIPGRY